MKQVTNGILRKKQSRKEYAHTHLKTKKCHDASLRLQNVHVNFIFAVAANSIHRVQYAIRVCFFHDLHPIIWFDKVICVIFVKPSCILIMAIPTLNNTIIC